MTKCFKGNTPKYVAESSILVLNQKCIRNNVIDFCDVFDYIANKIKLNNKINAELENNWNIVISRASHTW